jgi:hypothetical protein
MNGPQALPVDADFAALCAAAEGVAPNTPPRPVKLPPGGSSFAFTLDNDLVKLVTLRPANGSMTIAVRYAGDVVLEEERHVIRPAADPTIMADGLGLVLSWRAPLVEWLSWPLISRTRRF